MDTIKVILWALLPVLRSLVEALAGGVMREATRPDAARRADVNAKRARRYRDHFQRLRRIHEPAVLLLLTVGLAGGLGCRSRWEGVLVGTGAYAYTAEPTKAWLLIPTDGELVRAWSTIPAGWIVMAPPPEPEEVGPASKTGLTARNRRLAHFRTHVISLETHVLINTSKSKTTLTGPNRRSVKNSSKHKVASLALNAVLVRAGPSQPPPWGAEGTDIGRLFCARSWKMRGAAK